VNSANVIGVIGGSGVYDIDGLENRCWKRINSPFGEPSDELLFGDVGGRRLVFLPRHGRGHRLSPSSINYRANIDVLKRAGVTDLIAVSAVGSLREDFPPGTFVIVDQFIDRTVTREKSFFGSGCVAHVSMAKPTCSRLGDHLERAATMLSLSIVRGGTYVAMEGPQFSSLAESEMYRRMGCDVVGMTNMPEAKLAREAEICYASIAMVTDYDCWHPDHDYVTVEDIVRMVASNSVNARALVSSAISQVGADEHAASCPCRVALQNAFITKPEARDPEVMARLDAVAGRVLPVSREQSLDLRSFIRTIPDYPKPGIMFRDITTLLGHADGFRYAIDEFVKRFDSEKIDKVAAIESRGFLFGAPLAPRVSAGLVPIRKKGKLPFESISQEYMLEYGADSVEVHVDAISPGERVLLVDDLIATGGTAEAAVKLVERLGGSVIGAAFVIDLPELGGAARLRQRGIEVFSLCDFEGH